MSNEKIVSVARLKVSEDTVEEVKKTALGITADSRTEEGRVNYDVRSRSPE